MNLKQQQAFHARVVCVCSLLGLTAEDFRAWAQREGCHYRYFFGIVLQHLSPIVERYEPEELFEVLFWGLGPGESFDCQGIMYETRYTDAWPATYLPQLFMNNPAPALLRILVVAIISAGMFDYLKHQA